MEKNVTKASTPTNGHSHDDHGHDFVEIRINDEPKWIHRGHRTVVEIKTLGEVPLADVLNQVVDGQLTELTDDGAVTIKGGEVFFSHPRDSGSSCR